MFPAYCCFLYLIWANSAQINDKIMKTTLYSRTILRFLLLILMGSVWQQTLAQCGTASSYRPSVNATTVCSANQVYIRATGLPVTTWIYRDNNTGSWLTLAFNTDNTSQNINVSAVTIRTYKAVVSSLSCPSDTTQGVDVTLTPPVYGTNSSLQISGSSKQVCSGGQVTLRMMNQGVQPMFWLYRDNGGAWNYSSFTTSASLTVSAPSTSVPLIRDFCAVVKNASNCSLDSSAVYSVSISPADAGMNTTIVPTTTTPSICGGSGVSLQVDWPLEIGNWIYKDAGSSTWQVFTSGSTSVSDFNTNVAVSGMREYRAILKNPNTCSADTSGVCMVMINASQRRVLTSIQPRISGTNTTVCAGSSMSFQIPGYSNIQGWIYRDSANGNWVTSGSSGSQSISSSSSLASTITREVRVIINNSSTTCSYDTSAPVFYTIKANTRGNTTSAIPFVASAELCVGASATVYLQNGLNVNSWLYRTNQTGAWTSGFSSGNTYTDNSTSSFTSNTVRSYRAIINNTATCRADTTAEVQVLYKPAVPGGIVNITPTINQPAYCAGSTISGNISLNNNRQIVKWLYRDQQTGSWNDLPFATSTFFSDNNTNVTGFTTRSYRALVRTLETFTIDTSMEVSVDINTLSRGSVVVTPTSINGSVCNENNVTINIVPPTGYSVNNWIYRDTVSSSWSSQGSSSTSFSNYVSTLNNQRYYRAVLVNTNLCKYDTTNTLMMPVNKKVSRNNTSYLPTASVSSVCSGTTFNVSITLPAGVNVFRWVYRDNGSVWREISSSSTNYFENSTNTRVLVPTQREYKVILNDNNNCVSDTSAAVVVSINPYQTGAYSGIVPTTSMPVACAGSTISANFTYNGTIQKWMYRDNGAVWQEFSNNTASSFLSDANTTMVTSITNREYRAFLIRQNACLIDTTQTLSVQIRPLSNSTASAIQPVASAATVCSGNSFNVSINSGSGYSVHKWIVKEGAASEWSELLSNSSSTFYSVSNTAVNASVLRTYRAIVLTNTCSYDTTQPVSVQLNARTYGYANGVALTSANGVYCASSPVNVNVLSATMPGGGSVRSWMYMDNMSGPWLTIANLTSTSISHSNTDVQTPTTRSYRVVVNNSTTCSYDSSNVFSVSINPSAKGYASTITPTIFSTNICNASSNPTLNVSLPSGYTISKWIVNNNSTGWTDFGYNTNSTSIADYNTAVQSPVNRSYRAIVNNSNTCSVDSTNTISANINPAIRGVLATVTPTSSRTYYCYTKAVQVTVSVPSGYNIEKWIYNDNSTGWNDFVNSTTSSVLTDNNTYVSVVTSRAYRVIMLNNNTCQRDTTAELSVVINPRGGNIGLRTITPTANPATGICAGSNISLNVSPGTGNELIKWTFSDMGNAGPWYDVLGSYNSTSYTHQLTQLTTATTRLYRAIITDTSSCDFDSTQSVAVNITPISYSVDTSLSITASDSVCVGSSVNLSMSPGSGNSVVKWLYKDNNGPWKNFTNNTQTTSISDGNTLVAPGSTRGYTTLVLKNAVCRIDTLTKVKTVNFKNKTYGNSLTSVFISQDTVCSGNSLSVSTSGSVERWLYREGSTGSWNIITGTSTFLSHTATAVANSGWRYYTAMLNTGSCNADTAKYDSVYIRVQTNGNIAIAPTTSNAAVCAGNAVSITLSVSGANMQRWLFRDNGVGAWNILSTTTNFSVVDYNTAVTAPVSREYRAIVLRTCSYDTTNALTVTISPKTRGTDLTKVPTVASAGVCAASAIQNIQVTAGSGNSIVQWLSRDNGGAWQVFSSGNSNNLTDYNTYVGSVVTRSYVAIINNNTTCRFDTSAALTVTINPVVLGNSSRTVSAPTNGCMGSNYSVSLNVSGDSSVIRFLSNYNGGVWSDEGYINPTSNASISRYAYNGSPYTIGYRAVTYKSGNCHIDTTNPVEVSVVPRTYGNDNAITPSSMASACSGTSFSISVSPGSGNTVSHWVYSDDATTWIPYYSSSTSISQAFATNTVVTRQYRALIVKGSVCSIDTTAAKTITINPLINGTDNVSQVTVTSGSGVCIGSTINISVSPGSGSVNNWLYRDDGGMWNSLYASSINISDANTFVSSTVNREYATILWKASTCNLDTTLLTDTVAITPRSYGNDNAVTITPNNSSICVGNAVILTANVGTHSVQTWYYSDNGGAWSTLTSSTSSSVTDYNTGVSVSTTREYRALIRKSNVCAYDTSATATVTINPRSVGVDGAIVPTANASTVCSGNVVTLNVSVGSGNSIQKWIYRQNGGAWTDFVYTSATSVYDYNTTVASSITREYRAIVVKGSGCSIDTSSLVLVNISPIGFGNQPGIVPVASKSAICSGSNVTVSVGGFSGSSVLRWLYRDDNAGVWNILYSSATSITDFNTQTSVSFTRQYRAIINNTGGCSTDTTGEVSVSVSPISNGIISTPAQVSLPVVCSGNPVNVFINPPVGRAVTSWLYTDASGVWTLLSNTGSTSVNDFNTVVAANTTRMYRAVLSNAAGCSLDSSDVVSVNINLITAGTNLSVTPTTTTPSLCSGGTAIVGVGGFSGTVVKWLYRDSVVDGWASISNINFTLLHTGTLVSYSRTRTYRAIVYNANNCSNDTTAEVQLQINPQLAGNANSIAPTSPSSTACEGSSISLSATGFINGGVVVGWVYNDNGGAWIRISGASGTSFIHSNISVAGLTTRQYRALVLTGCTTDTTAALVITLDKFPIKPTIVVPAGTDSLICQETAATYEWRLNGNIIPGATQKVHEATESGTYSVLVGNTAGCKTLSDNIIHGKVGLSDVFANTNIQIYPNPTLDGEVRIDWQGLVVDQAHIAVMDMLGRIVFEKDVKVAGEQGASIDLSAQSGGIYFITLSAEGNSMTRKVQYQKQ